MSSVEYKTCDLCKAKTNYDFDTLLFGDWQRSRDIVVHYFCLLLSTNLPQRGEDCSGINGFLLRDIRREISAAAKRSCCYCGNANASISCCKCHEYFHIVCGRRNRCLFTFYGDFRSYCDQCIPIEAIKPAGLKSRPSSFARCTICREQMGLYNEVIFIFGKCCNEGYAHSVCMQKYALAAGYYLRCLWCGSKEFRNTVRLHGIFVPDREARWERERGAFDSLHRGHNRCDMEPCRCPRGRDYSSGKWSIILCSLCGSVGAHNPKCLPGKENSKVPLQVYKCMTCTRTEDSIANRSIRESQSTQLGDNNDQIDATIYLTKTSADIRQRTLVNDLPSFSDESGASSDSFVTVIPKITQTGPRTPVTNMKGGCCKRTPNRTEAIKSAYPTSDITLMEASSSTEVLAQEVAQTQLIEADICKTGNSEVAIMLQEDETQLFEDDCYVIRAIKGPAGKSPATQCLESPPAVPNSHNTDEVSVNQSPVISSSSQTTEVSENWMTFDAYQYNAAEGKCTGTATMRINIDDTRFDGKTLLQIQEDSCELLEESDVVALSNDVGLFAQIDAIIAEYL